MSGLRAKRMALVAVIAVVGGLAAVATAVVMSGRGSPTTSGACVDPSGDTYETFDNGPVLPGSTVGDMRLREEKDYVSWTVPTSPQPGSDLRLVRLTRDGAGLNITVQLDDGWKPFPDFDKVFTGPGTEPVGSSVQVGLRSDGWIGSVVIEDAPGNTSFRVGPPNAPLGNGTPIAEPVFDGDTATVKVPDALLDRFGSSFEFRASSSLGLPPDRVLADDCPAQSGDRTSPEWARLPNPVTEPPPEQPSSTPAPPPTSSTPPTVTTAPPTTQPTDPDTYPSPDAAAQAVWNAWQSGNSQLLAAISGPNVPDVLGPPNRSATLDPCVEEVPPLGSGTPSDPIVTARCRVNTEPNTILEIGPVSGGRLKVLNAYMDDGDG